MTMSKDRVRFLLPLQRLDSRKAGRSAYLNVLHDALGVNEQELLVHVTTIRGVRGIVIVCRPSQFARLLIVRLHAGIEHWFSDMRAELLPAEDVEPSTTAIMNLVADELDIDLCTVREFIQLLGVNEEHLARRYHANRPGKVPQIPFLDVSKRLNTVNGHVTSGNRGMGL